MTNFNVEYVVDQLASSVIGFEKKDKHQKPLPKKIDDELLEDSLAKDVGEGSASGKIGNNKNEILHVWEDEGGNLPSPKVPKKH